MKKAQITNSVFLLIMTFLFVGCTQEVSNLPTDQIQTEATETLDAGKQLIDGAQKLTEGNLDSLKEGSSQVVESGKVLAEKGESLLSVTKSTLGQIGDATESAVNTIEETAENAKDEVSQNIEKLNETKEEITQEIDEKISEISTTETEASNTFSNETYSLEKLNDFYGKKVVINFHADWCPTCNKLKAKLADENNAELLQNVIMLTADYDKDIQAKRNYGVTQQTTLIFLDETHNVSQKKINPGLADIADFFNN